MMKRVVALTISAILCLGQEVLADHLEWTDGQVTFQAEIEKMDGLISASELVCQALLIAPEELPEMFGFSKDSAQLVYDRTDARMEGPVEYLCGEGVVNASLPHIYAYRTAVGSILAGYAPEWTENHGENAMNEFRELEMVRGMEAFGIILRIRQCSSLIGHEVREHMKELKEELAWEEKKSGAVWREEDIQENAVVSRYECVQMIDDIPVFQPSREIASTDSFTFECETVIYCVDGQAVYFNGGVYRDVLEKGKDAPVISAEQAAEEFARGRNMLIGVEDTFCSRVRLEYMSVEEPGSLIYEKWRMVPAWVFYDGERVLGAVHALTGEEMILT